MWGVTTRSLRALFDRYVREVEAPALEELAREMRELEVGYPATLLAPTG